MIDSAAVEQRRRDVAAALGGLVHFTTPQQAHVTLWALGYESSGWPQQTLQLSVGTPWTFASAAYLRVESPDIAGLRGRLAGADLPDEERPAEFVPHVTIGPYRREVPLREVAERLRRFDRLEPIPATATVRVMAVDTRCPQFSLRAPSPPVGSPAPT